MFCELPHFRGITWQEPVVNYLAVHPMIRLLREDEHLVTKLLKLEGHPCQEIGDEIAFFSAGDTLWLLGSPFWYRKLCRALIKMSPERRPTTVLWNYEPLPFPRASGLKSPWPSVKRVMSALLQRPKITNMHFNLWTILKLQRAGALDVVAVSSLIRQESLAEHQIDSLVAPLGYHLNLGENLGLPRDIDVLLLDGLEHPRRRRAVRDLRQRGVRLELRGGWRNPNYWGSERTRLLNRVKIFLNVQILPGDLNGLRLQMGMANGAMVLSEPIYRPAPYVPGVHYVESTLDEMPRKIRYYLDNEGEREAIALAGHKLVTEEVTLKASVLEILEELNRAKSLVTDSHKPESSNPSRRKQSGCIGR